MTLLLIATLAMLAKQDVPPKGATASWCRGVVVNLTNGKKGQFLWFTAQGEPQALDGLKRAAAALHIDTSDSGSLTKTPGLVVSFKRSSIHPGGTKLADAEALLDRSKAGEFGKLTIKMFIVPLEPETEKMC